VRIATERTFLVSRVHFPKNVSQKLQIQPQNLGGKMVAGSKFAHILFLQSVAWNLLLSRAELKLHFDENRGAKGGRHPVGSNNSYTCFYFQFRRFAWQ
jgi:hypothetical protein